jgi:phospholipid/cholesterol/gamma-HCH transport system permease protein
MTDLAAPETARATRRDGAGGTEVEVGGSWRLDRATPRWEATAAGPRPAAVRLTAGALTHWDTSLVAFVGEAQHWCATGQVPCDTTALPEKLRGLAATFESALRTCGQDVHARTLTVEIGESTTRLGDQVLGFLDFVGEFAIDSSRLLRGRTRLRWGDTLNEMQRCGAMALPIVSLISFLVGVTLAYSGAIVLKRFGGEIWVADLIGVAMAREMGALMAAIILAGRTGAAFAAEIGSMKANEEIDALTTLGISAMRFLVVPRVLALGLMMPLLAIYALALGVLGGMAVAYFTLEIPPAAYWVEMLTIVTIQDLTVGVIKAVVFGLIVGLTGCLRGLESDRDANGVGLAATSAVVTAILLIIVADAIFAVIFNAVGL